MARIDEYIGETYEVLERLSADEWKRLEYETHQKAIRDYNTQMHGAECRGLQRGMERGMQQGLQQGLQQKLRTIVEKLLAKGNSAEEIAGLLNKIRPILSSPTVKGRILFFITHSYGLCSKCKVLR